jgi:hypothetical protein
LNNVEQRVRRVLSRRELMPFEDRDMEMEGMVQQCERELLDRRDAVLKLRKTRDEFALMLMLSLVINVLVVFMVLP